MTTPAAHSSGIPIPADFDNAVQLAILAAVKAKYRQQDVPESWRQFNWAWGGLLYRFCACAEHNEAFTESVTRAGASPPDPDRYVQEKHLFGFFVTGHSAIECLSYGLHALGSMVAPPSFPMATDADLR
jgi:hypothetical protein